MADTSGQESALDTDSGKRPDSARPCVKETCRDGSERAQGALFSPCRTWRYTLHRRWLTGDGIALFLMLNPSTADETANDPTVERSCRRAAALGYAGLDVCNLFAFRATDPADMKRAPDPVGPDNDRHIRQAASAASLVVCGWGEHGAHLGRAPAVVAMLKRDGRHLSALRVNASGHPAHPLYLPYSLTPQPFEQVERAFAQHPELGERP